VPRDAAVIGFHRRAAMIAEAHKRPDSSRTRQDPDTAPPGLAAHLAALDRLVLLPVPRPTPPVVRLWMPGAVSLFLPICYAAGDVMPTVWMGLIEP